MSRFVYPLALVVSLLSAAPALAQEIAAPPLTEVVAATQPAQSIAPAPVIARAIAPASKRPSLLIPMYAGFATLQGLDYHSTTRALASGAAREANPVMGAVVGNRPAFIAVKAASTAGVVLVGERLWKKNRAGAVVFMAVANGLMTAVVAHNYSVQ